MPAFLSAGVTPSLLAADLAATIDFYTALGFSITGQWRGDDGEWVELSRDGLVLQFFTKPPRGIPEAPCLSGVIYCHPSSVTALAEEWAGKVDFEWGPEFMLYGMREFAVRDPNGYLLAFTEPAG